MDQQAVTLLIEQSIHGNQKAFRKLVEIHQPFAWSVAFRLLCNDYKTEEVVQDAFIRVWKNLSGYKTEMRFSTWLYKIIVNLCYDSMKADKARNRISTRFSDHDALVNISSNDDPERELSNKEHAAIIRILTEELSPRQRVVFVLSELEELDVREITSITGMSAAKIKSNLYCARKEIKKKINILDNIRSNHVI